MDDNIDHQTTPSIGYSNSSEVFYIFFNGRQVKILWCDEAPSDSPIIRLCSLSHSIYLLLNQDKSLYEAKFDREKYVMHMKCIKTNVIDVEFCRAAKQVFLVLGEGAVLTQNILDCTKPLEEKQWAPVLFDPLELSEEGVKIKRVCCSSEATLFLSLTGDIYALGNCGAHFSVECEHPKLIRLFKYEMDILDICAGEKFFIFLARKAKTIMEKHLPGVHDYSK